MKPLRILVVEDNAMIGELLAEALVGFGHIVCAIERNVGDAAAAASRWRPDLMIVDVGLGEASRIDAVRAVLESGVVPHVFVTGDSLRGLPRGAETVLIQKPFGVSDLERTIERALSAAPAFDRVAT